MLVPEHIILSKEEEKEVLARFGITKIQLPKIKANDPVVKAMDAKEGDVLKILRKSEEGTPYYRLVIK
ncbi:DNA-directed RNA polymerase subunit H [Candidatus Micrarchaeota archaeon]|nr:DNA-directed RNA polymerase subunit H [Candidatus Micrarchaeota archaeon]